MDSVHHIWCPLSSQEYQDLPDGAETTLTLNVSGGDKLLHVHAAQGGLVLTPDSSGVRFQGAECDRYAYRDQNSLLVKEQ
ncbi:TPA: hypothetical protein MFM99_005180 [Klebsiella pneumoniae]|nr:hypothetical protein [Klebsiella pneumoniae]